MPSEILTKDDKTAIVHTLRDFVLRVASDTDNKWPVEVEVLPAVAKLRAVLNEIRYHFDMINGLIVADGATPEDTWPIDNSALIKRIREADDILDKLEHTRNPDCP